MHRIQAILLTGLFVFMLIKPAIPYLDYAVRKSYIIEKLCVNKDKPEMACNGKCHLKEQVQKNESSERDLPFPYPQPQRELQEFLVYSQANEMELPCNTFTEQLYINYYTFHFAESVFHPPVFRVPPQTSRTLDILLTGSMKGNLL
ncbi:MAG TPA: hypothetical protein ENI20_19610 [Bacteroides sp.]|nr:hypothetical protein [Bacteroides sp.]